jgi:UDPglucose 6-dehydrogenase
MPSSYRIGVVGLWHLGEIYSAGLSELGHTVTGVSDDSELIKNFTNDTPPLPEPRLAELLKKNREAGRLKYTTDWSELKQCNVLWITFDTPVDEHDDVHLDVIWDALGKAAPYLQQDVLVVATSQLPVGTAREIHAFLTARRPDLKFNYAYTPENLQLGEAMRCFLEPGRIVVGAADEATFKVMREIFSGINAEILEMSVASAEMAKHALNAYLATSITFANEIADLCEKTGADIREVTRALKSDPRIGQKAFLGAGLGFSGGTLPRDLKILMNLAKTHGISPSLADTVFEKNNLRKEMVVRRLREALGDIKGRTLAIFGLTYKAGTRTLRRSRALEIAEELSSLGASLRLHDPAVLAEEVPDISGAHFFSDPYEAATDARAIICITPCAEFRTMDFSKLSSKANEHPIFFDTSNFLSEQEADIKKAGFTYWGIGRS